MRVLLVEDEPKAAAELRRMLEKLPEPIQVVGCIPSIARTLEWFATNPVPELIMADIHLQDGLSFEVFKGVDVDIPVIFCTAYNEHASAAFASNGIDYLLKPIDPLALANSIRKLYRIDDQSSLRSTTKQLQNILPRLLEPYEQTILVHHPDKMMPIAVDTICYIHVRQNIVYVRTQEDDYAIYQTLNSLTGYLNSSDFYRANQNYLIHRQSILKIESLWTRRLKVTLSPKTDKSVIISRANASNFLRWVEEKPSANRFG